MVVTVLRTTSASSVGDLTLAVVVGVGQYADSKIASLPAAATEALAIRDALVDPGGCRVPRENVDLLTDEYATRDQILAAVRSACERATTDHSLFIYYAGHGADVGAQFALATFDTKALNYSKTGIASTELEDILRDLKARGVLLVLDCCGGATLAEGAPGVFRTVGQSADYRILLSSARSGQSSWEGAKGSTFSQSLVDVLNGSARLNSDGGAIYFSDLYRFLHDRVTVDVESAGPGAGAQEPIATASYARDPLLFLHAGLTLDQVRVRTQRYSKEDVRRILVRWIGGLLASAGVAVVGVWAFVAGHHFLSIDDGVVALYRGHPGLRVLAYPRLVWQYDVRTDEISSSSPLAEARPVLSEWGQDFRDEPLNHLNSVGRARWLINEGRSQEAIVELAKLLADPAKTAEWTKGALMSISIASVGNAHELELYARAGQPNVATAAMSRLMAIAPERGAVVANEMGFGLGTRGIHLQVLADLPTGCPVGTQQYLDGFASDENNGQFARLEIDAALRTGCKLSNAAIAAMGQPAYLESAARYLDLTDPDRGNDLRNLFRRAFESHLAGIGVAMSLNAAAGYLSGASPSSSCPSVQTFDSLRSVAAKLAAARAFVRQCSDATLFLSSTADPKTFRCELTIKGRTDATLLAVDILYSDSFATFWPILDSIRLRGAAQSAAVLRQLAMTHADSTVRRYAVRLLRFANVPAMASLAAFEKTGDQGLQIEAYLWVAQTEREKVLARVRDRLPEDTADFLPVVVTKLSLSQDEREAMLAAAQASQVSERTRATVKAMLADAEAVAQQLVDANAKRRAWVADWLGCRDDLTQIAKLLPKRLWHDQPTEVTIRQIEGKRGMLAGELRGLNPEDSSWRIRLMLDMRQMNESGLRAWLQNQCRWCD